MRAEPTKETTAATSHAEETALMLEPITFALTEPLARAFGALRSEGSVLLGLLQSPAAGLRSPGVALWRRWSADHC